MEKTYHLMAGFLVFFSMAAFGISSYEVKLQVKFLDGTSATDTLITEGNEWTTNDFGSNTLKFKVEPINDEKVKTTLEVTGPGEQSPNQSQLISRLGSDQFSSMEFKSDETGKTREIKLIVKKNILNDSEKY